jgi:DNA-binding response OmpR family regulator
LISSDLQLTPIEMNLVATLARAGERLVTFEELLSLAWGRGPRQSERFRQLDADRTNHRPRDRFPGTPMSTGCCALQI